MPNENQLDSPFSTNPSSYNPLIADWQDLNTIFTNWEKTLTPQDFQTSIKEAILLGYIQLIDVTNLENPQTNLNNKTETLSSETSKNIK